MLCAWQKCGAFLVSLHDASAVFVRKMSTGYEAGASEENVQRDKALFEHFDGRVSLARLSQLRAQAATAINSAAEYRARVIKERCRSVYDARQTHIV